MLLLKDPISLDNLLSGNTKEIKCKRTVKAILIDDDDDTCAVRDTTFVSGYIQVCEPALV